MALDCDKFLDGLEKALTQAAAVVEAKAKENAPVDTGNLRRSITHEVNYPVAIIGSNADYAPYVEKGTGMYASDGNGRQERPWIYTNAKGEVIATNGSEAHHFLEDAIRDSRQDILDCFKNIFGD